MNRPTWIGIAVIVVLAAFVAGRLTSPHAKGRDPGARRVLYYVDPMHPAYRSDRPGTAPDCGMPLEPVREGDDPLAGPGLAPGAIALDPSRLQMAGVRVEPVAASSGEVHLRIPGRVMADPGRVYPVVAAAAGWVQSLGNTAEGAVVRRGDVLATFYSLEFRAAEQAYVSAVTGREWRRGADRDSSAELPPGTPGTPGSGNALITPSVRIAEEQLRLLGMGDAQIQELARSRQVTRDIQVDAPVSGVVLARNVSPELRFEKGFELFRIADLSRVWIQADLFGDEHRHLRPGTRVEVAVRELGRTFVATVSDAPPTFDAATHTLKLRLEMANPGMVLRPDMYVDLALEAPAPPGLSVPADAVIDSGHRRIVYVETGAGVFEPRRIETGERYGDRVIVQRGLAVGEHVVAEGTFLVDSESRMRLASGAAPGGGSSDPPPATTGARDAVCGMTVDTTRALAAGHWQKFRARTWWFCSAACAGRFRADPAEWAGADAGTGTGAAPRASRRDD
jgi:Cu(I)/Ag(I) efflux system membrane fusion protein